MTSSSFSSGISSGLSSSSGLRGSIASGRSKIGSSFSSSGLAAFFFSLGEPFAFFGFLGFLSLLVSVYTLILVSLQFRCFGVRRTFPSVLATTHEGTGWACFRACERCFFFPDGLCRAIVTLS